MCEAFTQYQKGTLSEQHFYAKYENITSTIKELQDSIDAVASSRETRKNKNA